MRPSLRRESVQTGLAPPTRKSVKRQASFASEGTISVVKTVSQPSESTTLKAPSRKSVGQRVSINTGVSRKSVGSRQSISRQSGFQAGSRKSRKSNLEGRPSVKRATILGEQESSENLGGVFSPRDEAFMRIVNSKVKNLWHKSREERDAYLRDDDSSSSSSEEGDEEGLDVVHEGDDDEADTKSDRGDAPQDSPKRESKVEVGEKSRPSMARKRITQLFKTVGDATKESLQARNVVNVLTAFTGRRTIMAEVEIQQPTDIVEDALDGPDQRDGSAKSIKNCVEGICDRWHQVSSAKKINSEREIKGIRDALGEVLLKYNEAKEKLDGLWRRLDEEGLQEATLCADLESTQNVCDECRGAVQILRNLVLGLGISESKLGHWDPTAELEVMLSSRIIDLRMAGFEAADNVRRRLSSAAIAPPEIIPAQRRASRRTSYRPSATHEDIGAALEGISISRQKSARGSQLGINPNLINDLQHRGSFMAPSHRGSFIQPRGSIIASQRGSVINNIQPEFNIFPASHRGSMIQPDFGKVASHRGSMIQPRGSIIGSHRGSVIAPSQRGSVIQPDLTLLQPDFNTGASELKVQPRGSIVASHRGSVIQPAQRGSVIQPSFEKIGSLQASHRGSVIQSDLKPEDSLVLAQDEELKEKLKREGYRTKGKVVAHLDGNDKVQVEWPNKALGGEPLRETVEVEKVQIGAQIVGGLRGPLGSAVPPRGSIIASHRGSLMQPDISNLEIGTSGDEQRHKRPVIRHNQTVSNLYGHRQTEPEEHDNQPVKGRKTEGQKYGHSLSVQNTVEKASSKLLQMWASNNCQSQQILSTFEDTIVQEMNARNSGPLTSISKAIRRSSAEENLNRGSESLDNQLVTRSSVASSVASSRASSLEDGSGNYRKTISAPESNSRTVRTSVRTSRTSKASLELGSSFRTSRTEPYRTEIENVATTALSTVVHEDDEEDVVSTASKKVMNYANLWQKYRRLSQLTQAYHATEQDIEGAATSSTSTSKSRGMLSLAKDILSQPSQKQRSVAEPSVSSEENRPGTNSLEYKRGRGHSKDCIPEDQDVEFSPKNAQDAVESEEEQKSANIKSSLRYSQKESATPKSSGPAVKGRLPGVLARSQRVEEEMNAPRGVTSSGVLSQSKRIDEAEMSAPKGILRNSKEDHVIDLRQSSKSSRIKVNDPEPEVDLDDDDDHGTSSAAWSLDFGYQAFKLRERRSLAQTAEEGMANSVSQTCFELEESAEADIAQIESQQCVCELGLWRFGLCVFCQRQCQQEPSVKIKDKVPRPGGELYVKALTYAHEALEARTLPMTSCLGFATAGTQTAFPADDDDWEDNEVSFYGDEKNISLDQSTLTGGDSEASDQEDLPSTPQTPDESNRAPNRAGARFRKTGRNPRGASCYQGDWGEDDKEKTSSKKQERRVKRALVDILRALRRQSRGNGSFVGRAPVVGRFTTVFSSNPFSMGGTDSESMSFNPGKFAANDSMGFAGSFNPTTFDDGDDSVPFTPIVKTRLAFKN